MEIHLEVQLHRKMSFVVDDGDGEWYPLLLVHVVRHHFLALFVFLLVLHPVTDVLVFLAVTLLDGATDALLYLSVVVPF